MFLPEWAEINRSQKKVRISGDSPSLFVWVNGWENLYSLQFSKNYNCTILV